MDDNDMIATLRGIVDVLRSVNEERNRPRRIVRDENGDVIGMEPYQAEFEHGNG